MLRLVGTKIVVLGVALAVADIVLNNDSHLLGVSGLIVVFVGIYVLMSSKR